MENLSCLIGRSLDAKLTKAANERKLDRIEPYTKSGIVSASLNDFLQSNIQPNDRKPRDTSDRVNRNFQIPTDLKRRLARKVNAVKANFNISHYAAFGGWVELALEQWLNANATMRRRRETREEED